MRVVTFHVQTLDAHPNVRWSHAEYLRLLDWMLRSVLRFHPEARLAVLTDAQTDLSPLSVAFERIDHPVDHRRIMLSRAEAQQRFLQTHFDDDVLFLDSDMLLNGPLTELFEDGQGAADCDVALTVRDDADMPVNGGFLLLRHRRADVARRFFDRYLRLFREVYVGEAAWYGDQRALRDAIGWNGSGASSQIEARIRLLPCERYNHTPGDRIRKVLRPQGDKRVLHFKGDRKRLMALFWYTWLAGLPKPVGIVVWCFDEARQRLRRALKPRMDAPPASRPARSESTIR